MVKLANLAVDHMLSKKTLLDSGKCLKILNKSFKILPNVTFYLICYHCYTCLHINHRKERGVKEEVYGYRRDNDIKSEMNDFT